MKINISKYENIKIQIIILIVGISLFVVKLIAWYITESISILTDAIESIINIVGACIGLVSLYISSFPKDLNHPNGHGKIEYISSSIEGLLVLFTGIIIIFKAISRIFINTEIGRLDSGILLIFITAFINYILGSLSIKYGIKNNSIALISSGEHLKTDTYSSIGVMVGLFLIYITNWFLLDSIVAIMYGFIVIYTGYKVLRLSIAGIMDESNKKLINMVKIELNKLISNDTYLELYDLNVINYGNILHIDCVLLYKYKPKNTNNLFIIDKMEFIQKNIQLKFKEEINIFYFIKK